MRWEGGRDRGREGGENFTETGGGQKGETKTEVKYSLGFPFDGNEISTDQT